MNREPQQFLPEVIRIARTAGEAILQHYEAEIEVREKQDSTPLTDADMAADRVIVESLGRLTPDIPVLSEESDAPAYEERRQWQRYWLVDPLDGTREFIKRNGEFSVNIALIEDHQPVLGVILAPVTGLCYYASRGNGAFRRDADNTPHAIQVKSADAHRPIVAGSRSRQRQNLLAFLQQFEDYELISLGSSLKSCLVAEGGADVYPRRGPTSEWDTAAAQCIVEEAGGSITDDEGRPLRYNCKESLLNPDFIVYGDPQVDWLSYFNRL